MQKDIEESTTQFMNYFSRDSERKIACLSITFAVMKPKKDSWFAVEEEVIFEVWTIPVTLKYFKEGQRRAEDFMKQDSDFQKEAAHLVLINFFLCFINFIKK